MRIEVVDADQVRIHFEAAVTEVGAGKAKTAFARAMNREGRKTMVQVKRALVHQTSIKSAMVSASLRFRSATSTRLETRIEGRGSAVPLIRFGAREGPRGVSAFVWGRQQTFEHTFIVARFGNVYKRTGRARGPIESLYGPAIPKELVKDESLAAFYAGGQGVAKEAARQVALMLSGAIR